MKKYIILDWAGNHKFQTETFDSFEDAWEYVYAFFGHLDGKEFEETIGEFQVVEYKGPREYRFLDPNDPRVYHQGQACDLQSDIDCGLVKPVEDWKEGWKVSASARYQLPQRAGSQSYIVQSRTS